MRKAVITNVGYALGDQSFSIEQAAEQKLLVSPLDSLKEAGFQTHHRASKNVSAYNLAVSAVRELRESGSHLDDVDAILYNVCLPENANTGSYKDFKDSGDVKHLMDFPGSRLQTEMEMPNAFVLGIVQQACTGLFGVLRVARSMIATEPEIKKILCVTADRFPEGAFYEQAFNLISDGAAATLVEADAKEGYEILGCHQITNGAMANASDDETVGHFFSYSSRVVQELVSKSGIGMNDIRWLVGQNTHTKAWQVLSSLLGIPFDRVFHASLPLIGHMISGDNMVNLWELHNSGNVNKDDKLLMLTAGFGLNWASTLLQRRE